MPDESLWKVVDESFEKKEGYGGSVRRPSLSADQKNQISIGESINFDPEVIEILRNDIRNGIMGG